MSCFTGKTGSWFLLNTTIGSADIVARVAAGTARMDLKNQLIVNG
jgi:hypothetical protein